MLAMFQSLGKIKRPSGASVQFSGGHQKMCQRYFRPAEYTTKTKPKTDPKTNPDPNPNSNPISLVFLLWLGLGLVY